MSTARDNCHPVKSLQVKLKNRRVTGSILKDGSFVFKYRRLHQKEIIITRIRLTQEALAGMCAIANALTGRDK